MTLIEKFLSFASLFMKKILKKLLFISLLFSVAMPFEVQAIDFNWNAWKNRTAEVRSKTTNWLSTSGRNALIFLTKRSIAGVVIRAAIVSMLSCFVWEKYLTEGSTKGEFIFIKMGPYISACITGIIIEIAISWRDKYFLDAVKSKNVVKAKRALQLGADKIFDGKLVLIAASNNDLEMMKLLVDYGAGVYRYYPVLLLNFESHFNLGAIEFLIEKDLVGASGHANILIYAAERHCLSLVKLLHKKNININIDTIISVNGQRSTLALFKFYDDLEAIKFFIEKNLVDASEKTGILTYALKNGHLDLVKSLLENDVDINGRDERGETVLMAVASGEFPDIVKFLLSKNVNIDMEDGRGYTALRCAVEEKNEFDQEVVKEWGGISQYKKWKVENPEGGAVAEKWEAENAKTIELLKEAHNKKISES